MEHDSAVQAKLAERYVLGELSLQEREEFEEHFFDCAVCAEQVQETAVFADNALHALRTESWEERRITAQAAPRPSWADWLRSRFAIPLAAACTVLLAVNVLQFSLLRNAKQELALAETLQPISAITLTQTRGLDGAGAPTIRLGSGGRFFELIVDIPPDKEAPVYGYTLSSANGFSEQGSIPAPPDQGPVRLLLAAARFVPGRYTLRVQSGPDQYQDFQFELQR